MQAIHSMERSSNMFGIGQKFPQYSPHRRRLATTRPRRSSTFDARHPQGQVAGRVLLAQGLHLRVPDRDRGVRQARQASSRTATRSCSASRTDSEFVHLAWRQRPRDLQRPAVPDARRHQARAVDGARHPRPEAASRSARPYIVDPEGVIRFVYVTDLTSAATRRKCCACSTRCRPTSCAPATGRRAKTP